MCIDPGDSAAVVVLATGLHDPDIRIRRAAADSYRYCPELGKPVLPSLAKALSDPDVEVRIAVIQSLEALGAEAASAIPALVPLMDDSEQRVRVMARLAIATINKARSMKSK
jgi:HEAT repeat protein